mmetsp:Transcript_33185/g.56761  ORF Transcript_33185/g.56761 Transcript_33185/m.56761 type:complete len:232 (+) Transcript_33185:875-1570(+)
MVRVAVQGALHEWRRGRLTKVGIAPGGCGRIAENVRHPGLGRHDGWRSRRHIATERPSAGARVSIIRGRIATAVAGCRPARGRGDCTGWTRGLGTRLRRLGTAVRLRWYSRRRAAPCAQPALALVQHGKRVGTPGLFGRALRKSFVRGRGLWRRRHDRRAVVGPSLAEEAPDIERDRLQLEHQSEVQFERDLSLRLELIARIEHRLDWEGEVLQTFVSEAGLHLVVKREHL